MDSVGSTKPESESQDSDEPAPPGTSTYTLNKVRLIHSMSIMNDTFLIIDKHQYVGICVPVFIDSYHY